MALPLKYSARNLWVRRSTTLATMIGIALVVFVFVAVLMMANGVERTMVDSGAENNAVIVRNGATSELVSSIDREQANIVKNLPQVARSPEGKALVANELVVIINTPKRNGDSSNLTVRGATPESLAIRPHLKLVKGRAWQPGTSELIVGAAVVKNFAKSQIGDIIRFGNRDWTIVGQFDAGGTGFDSEVWGDNEQLMQAFKRPVFSSLTLQLPSPNDLQALQEEVKKDKRLTFEIKSERQFYADQSKMLSIFIRALGMIVSIIFSIGALIGAMITMYASVANRTREIGTLRALGFSRSSILGAFCLESLLLSLAGGVLGMGAASLMGFVEISTTNFATFSELQFSFALSPQIILSAVIFCLIIGLVGGVFPAFRASRLKIVEALRTT